MTDTTQNRLASPPRALILDMDGVLYRGDSPLGDLPSIFERIRRMGLDFVLATNNATRTPQQVAEKLARFGVEVSTHQIINSAQAAAHLIALRFPKGGPVYAVGEDGLLQALQEAGFEHHDPPAEGTLAVVAGLDRGFNYQKLSRASMLVREGALFVGTNLDPTYPSPRGLQPGAGSVIAAIATASGVPAVFAGKPEPGMYQVALERMGVTARETLVVGDRLDTDLAGALALSCPTALVLTGVTTSEEARSASPQPDLVAPDLAAVISTLESIL
jgi:4-nitrophenyl phosphatase